MIQLHLNALQPFIPQAEINTIFCYMLPPCDTDDGRAWDSRGRNHFHLGICLLRPGLHGRNLHRTCVQRHLIGHNIVRKPGQRLPIHCNL